MDQKYTEMNIDYRPRYIHLPFTARTADRSHEVDSFQEKNDRVAYYQIHPKQSKAKHHEQ